MSNLTPTEQKGITFRDWIFILGFLVALVGFSFESCMTRSEITGKLEAINKDLDEAREHRNRIEDKVGELNQNYIDHLVKHNEK